jgi:hypothetical protein
MRTKRKTPSHWEGVFRINTFLLKDYYFTVR